MGFFRSECGKLIVKFYGDPRNTMAEDEVSVAYTTTRGDAFNIASDFWRYTGKVLSNMGNDPAARMLQNLLVEMIKNEEIGKNKNILQGDNYKLKKVLERKGHVKICEARFYDNNTINTKFSWGGESYYAPMSAIAFLQHIIDELSVEKLKEVNESLGEFLRIAIITQ